MTCQPSSAPVTEPDVRQARDCLQRFGRSASAYQILNPGFRLWFAADREAVVGYVDHHSYRVAASAPVCAAIRLNQVMEEFQAHTRQAGRRVCYFGVESWMFPALERHSSSSLVILGAQPAWNPANWLRTVERHASLRAQLHRARNKGVDVVEWPAARGRNHPNLQRCLADWLASRGLPPMHFLVEPETLGSLVDRRLFVARRHGGIVGFLVASPVPQRRGWLVEQLVRGQGAVNGTTELMLEAAMRILAAEGAPYVTLGLAALSRRAGLDYSMNPFWLRLVFSWARAHGSRFYNFAGLDAFKAKFEPEHWEPLYAFTPASRFPPAAFYAIAAAFSNGSPLRLMGRACARAVRMECAWMLDWLLGR